MSFEDEYHSSQNSGRISRPAARVQPQPETSSSVASITENIARLEDNTNTMIRMVKKLGTEQDTSEFRAALRAKRLESRNISKQISVLLGTSGYQSADWRIQQVRLKKDFEVALKRLRDVNINAQDKEAAYVAKVREQGNPENFPDMLLHNDEEERQSLIESEEKRQQAIRLDNMMQYNENLIAERHEDVKQIEQDVMEINEIFRDLAVMVSDQGTKIEQISDHIQSTSDNTGAASEEVDKAYDSHKKARKRTCMLVLILMAAVIIVTVIIISTIKR